MEHGHDRWLPSLLLGLLGLTSILPRCWFKLSAKQGVQRWGEGKNWSSFLLFHIQGSWVLSSSKINFLSSSTESVLTMNPSQESVNWVPMSHPCIFGKAVTETHGSDFGGRGCSTAGRESLCKHCSGTFIYSSCWSHCPQDACNHSNGSGGGFSLCTDQTVAADGISTGDYPDWATVADGESTLRAQADGNPWPWW